MSRWGKLITLLLLAALAVSQAGCSGCWEDPIARKQRLQKLEEEKKKKEEEKKQAQKEKKDDFQTEKLQVLPSAPGTPQAFCKPGHWTVANQRMVANNFEFRAEMHCLATTINGAPLPLQGDPHALSTSRPVSLPKGQWKDIELLYFAPPRPANTKNAWMQNNMTSASTGAEVFKKPEPLSEMKAYEYFMVVLADNADDYGFLKLLHSTQPLVNDAMSETTIAHYRVSLPKIERLAPLPDNGLAWTSISVIVWDDLDPKLLTPDQQQALLDWLHFGGQLLISGPRSWSTLKGSFLNDFLPATAAEGVNLTNDDMQPLSDHWTIPGRKETLPIIIPDKAPLLGLVMTPHPAAYALPGCEGLLLERRVGRGRVCLSAFPLDSDAIKNWPSFDSFVNAVLLRRPAREYAENPELLSAVLQYADQEYRPLREEARINSLVRYFSRDIEPLAKAPQEEPQILVPVGRQPGTTTIISDDPFAGEVRVDLAQAEPAPAQPTNLIYRTKLERTDSRFGGWEQEAASGVGGWSDFNGTSDAARNILQKAAGISVPKVDFVLRTLAIYLLVLVPLNWLIFRMIGRVELAWIAAPVIAIVGAGAVIRMAQLDIGFARSQTDLAVLELHEGYRRAHLTRYTALYTSLSTNYELEFTDSTALALPFSANPTPRQSNFNRMPVATEIVNLQRGRNIKLTNLQISSNTTGMAHSEQMYDCGGALDYKADPGLLLNNTSLTLREAVVVRSTSAGTLEFAKIGTFRPASSHKLQFKELEQPADSFAGQTSRLFPPSPERNAEKAVNLDRMLQLAVEQLHLFPNETRLVAWTDDKLEGLTVRPEAAQYTGRTMVLAHLVPAELPEPQPDKNLRIDFNLRNSIGDEGIDLSPGEEEVPATF